MPAECRRFIATVGRIYEVRGSPPDLRWFWSLHLLILDEPIPTRQPAGKCLALAAPHPHLGPRRTDTMTTTYGFDFEFAGPRSRGARIARIDALATLLDTALVIPGTNVRFGLDALIGLFPAVGDIITTALSLFIVHEAYQLGAPGHVIARMLGNVALDGVFGAVPLVGDAFDVLWRANRRNMRLLREWLEREEGRF